MISCTHVQAHYGDHAVLHDISFRVAGGECLAILGPNGCGKTTLLRLLSGEKKPSHGQIFLEGKNLQEIPSRKRAQQLAVVPQRLLHLPNITAYDMTLLGRYPYLRWTGLYTHNDYMIANDALAQAGASQVRERRIQELSGGEMQRVLLARALAQQSSVLLLDELSAGLDMARMLELFTALDVKRKAGSCLVTVMHDINLAALFATRLMGIKHGRICFDGPVHETFTEEYLCDLYETKLHVFPHPVLSVPQACLGLT